MKTLIFSLIPRAFSQYMNSAFASIPVPAPQTTLRYSLIRYWIVSYVLANQNPVLTPLYTVCSRNHWGVWKRNCIAASELVADITPYRGPRYHTPCRHSFPMGCTNTVREGVAKFHTPLGDVFVPSSPKFGYFFAQTSSPSIVGRRRGGSHPGSTSPTTSEE